MRRSQHAFRTTIIATIISSLLASCATTPGMQSGKGAGFNNPFISDDPCANTSRNIGIAIGAIGGAVLGHYTGKKKSGALIGAGVGAAIGGLVGYSMDKKRCELAQLAQKHQLEMTVSAINADGGQVALDVNTKVTTSAIGLAVNITDKERQGGHFLPGSDKLTPQAEQYFAELARIYNPTRAGEEEVDKYKKAELLKLAEQKKLLLVGHTDDIGSSKNNAELSERRARAVALFLARNGIPEDMLYYQGAGETFPIADNRLESGRAQNRRVELVELAGETQFHTYLELRTPRYEYYRGSDQQAVHIAGAESADSKKKPAAVKSGSRANAQTGTSLPITKTTSTPETAKAGNKPNAANSAQTRLDAAKDRPAIPPVAKNPAIDFGGNPVSSKSVGLDYGNISREDSGSSLINKAWADDVPLAGNCSADRPRVSGQVKLLASGKTYATSEYMPGLYNTSWVDKVNGHLIALNKVAVLRQGAQVARPPELLIYPNYQNDASAKAAVRLTPQVNAYRGSKGLLYRVFVNQDASLQCIDLVLPYSPPFSARGGYVYQQKSNGLFRAPYTPKVVGS